jgi:hypothetical protein
MNASKVGRKPLKEGDPTVVVHIKMPQSLKEKLMRLGGAEWLRDRIEKAKEPTSKE